MLSWRNARVNRSFLVVPRLLLYPPYRLWRSWAAAVGRAELEVQLGPHLAVFGLEAQISLASRAPNTSEGVHKEPELRYIVM